MKSKKTDSFGHTRTIYIVGSKTVLPAKYFGSKSRNDFDKWAISNGAFIESYAPDLKTALQKATAGCGLIIGLVIPYQLE